MSRENVVGERRPGVRVSKIPNFKEWVLDKPEVTGMTQRMQKLLFHVVRTQDATVIRVNDELRRFSRVATVDVFFRTPTTTYQLHETRTKIRPGRDIDEVLTEVKQGDLNGVIETLVRNNGNSISERSKLNGEFPEETAFRAVKEELFSTVLEERDDKAYPHIDEVIDANLILHAGVKRSNRDAKDPVNGIKGLPVSYFLHHAEITFTENMPVPIDVVDGVPQSLYEKEEGKYISIYEWFPVEKHP